MSANCFNNLCYLDVSMENLLDTIVLFFMELRCPGGHKGCVFQIFYSKPPSRAGRFMVDSEWLRDRVDRVKKMFMTDW